MKIFSIDQHISGQLDYCNIFGNLGHSLDCITLSSHASVIGKHQNSIPSLDGNKWSGFVQRQEWDNFYNEYHEELDCYDAFLTFYPPIFSYLYKRFDKPIIVTIPIRYEYPCQSDSDDWIKFNDYLKSGIDNNQITLIANNLYDKKYTEAFIDREVKYIPSLCEYTNVQYNTSNIGKDIVYYSAQKYNNELYSSTGLFKWRSDVLPHGFNWSDWLKFKAITHFPYNISTMSFFEQYAANIPLFVPTIEFLIDLYYRKYRVLEQVSWVSTFGRPAGSVIKPVVDCPDPNDFNNIESWKYWLPFADYYNQDELPHINYFGSFDELNRMAYEIDYIGTSNMMKSTNIKRKHNIYEDWKRVLNNIGGIK